MPSFNRDYLRDESGEGDSPGWGYDIVATKRLVIALVAVFASQFVLTFPVGGGRTSVVEYFFPLTLVDVQAWQVWRLLTYWLVNPVTNPIGFVFDLLVLWWVGGALERMYGGRETILFQTVSAFAAGLVFLISAAATGSPSSYYSAQVLVLASLSLYAVHFPKQEILLYGLIPVQMRAIVAFYALYSFYPVLMALSREANFWTAVPTGAGNLAALAFPLLYTRWFGQLERFLPTQGPRGWWRSMRMALKRRRLRVFEPEAPVEQLDLQVDQILAKISEQGSDSLTAKERAILTQASQRYKQRES